MQVGGRGRGHYIWYTRGQGWPQMVPILGGWAGLYSRVSWVVDNELHGLVPRRIGRDVLREGGMEGGRKGWREKGMEGGGDRPFL